MKWIMGYAAALCVLVLIISQSIIIPTFFTPFFRWHFNRAEVAAEIGIRDDDLMHVTHELLAYMRGRRDSLHGITAEVQGPHERGNRIYGQNFFTDREITHMYDVRELYDLLFMTRNISLFSLIALIFAMIYFRHKPLELLSRCSREVLVGFFILMLAVAGISAIDFSRAWDIFHYIFFFRDADQTWRLTRFVDLMINMFPLEFFISISIFIAALITIFSALICTFSSVYLYKHRGARND
ncbi:MAG: TIGR01906 family membrane protein [Defluviitaleaceae bacterium]|nr:TIGR01906 family membrane protein [Defluviitaleaceae bacterium]